MLLAGVRGLVVNSYGRVKITLDASVGRTILQVEHGQHTLDGEGDTMNEYRIGERVRLHAATSEWMQGDRYGEVVGFGRSREYVDTFDKDIVMARPVKVRLDVSGRVRRFHPDNLFTVQS